MNTASLCLLVIEVDCRVNKEGIEVDLLAAAAGGTPQQVAPTCAED